MVKNDKKSNKYPIGVQGPCWPGFIFIGPSPGAKGSCIKKSKYLANSKKTKRGGNRQPIIEVDGKVGVLLPSGIDKVVEMGFALRDNGYKGSTDAGFSSGEHIVTAYTKGIAGLPKGYIDIEHLLHMSAWFSRHGPDAANGGTSYPGYCRWIEDGQPTDGQTGLGNYRGAVGWLVWGGDQAYLLLKDKTVQKYLADNYSITLDSNNNLMC